MFPVRARKTQVTDESISDEGGQTLPISMRAAAAAPYLTSLNAGQRAADRRAPETTRESRAKGTGWSPNGSPIAILQAPSSTRTD